VSNSKSITAVILLTILTSALIPGVNNFSTHANAQNQTNSTGSLNSNQHLNWYGFAKDADDSISDWKSALQKWSKYGPGGVHRVAMRFSDLDLNHLDQILDLIYASGARAGLDYHVVFSYPGFGPLFGSQACRDWWQNLTIRYKDDPRVIAFEFANEPSYSSVVPSMRSNLSLGIIREYANLTDMVHQIDPSRICVWIDYWNLDPTPYYRDNVVITFHPYSFSELDTEAQLQLDLQGRFNEVEGRANGLWPIWCGELESVPDTTGPLREAYYVEMFKQCIAKGYGFNYWRYYNKLDDGGLDPDEILRLAGFTRIPITSSNLTIQTPKGMGTTSPGTGKQTSIQETDIQVSATPASGWDFDHWVLDGSYIVKINPFNVTMDVDHTIQAVFSKIPLKNFKLTIEVPTGSGYTSIVNGTHTYIQGTSLNVTATPASGWAFDHWELNGTEIGTMNPYIAKVNANYQLKAIFIRNPWDMGGGFFSYPLEILAAAIILATITLMVLTKRRQVHT
jgi:hypothetical protein